MVVVRGHNLNWALDAFVSDHVQELARIRSDVLVLNQIELNDGRALLVCAFADERNQ